MLRKPNSIPKGDTIIEDKAIEPYFLVKSQTGGYVIYKNGMGLSLQCHTKQCGFTINNILDEKDL